MIDRDVVNEAIKTGHKASEVIRDFIVELAEIGNCPDGNGFEGIDTYPDCGVCPICIAKELTKLNHL